MSLPLSFVKTDHLRFPRVSGDEPISPLGVDHDVEFSPRERG